MCDLGDLLCKGLLLGSLSIYVLAMHSNMVSKILVSRKKSFVKHEMMQVLGKYI